MTDTAKTSPEIIKAIDAGALTTASDLPDDFDPLADGILMSHQKEWLADKSPLKLAEKCRRSGFTFAEALDDAITASTDKAEGGDNVFYIGDTKDKGREFINYCAHFAKTVAGELLSIDEYMFDDLKDDGSTNQISAFRITFASGNRIVALSSRPENIRGLQGIVVIDEAAFHKDVGEVIDAAMALIIWGGRIRIISTHNGKLNAFNELVTRTNAGKTKFSPHRITFDEVVENGLYERVKLMRPDIMPKDEWYELIRGGYIDEARMREELDAIPRDAEGSALSRVQVEACKDASVPVFRLAKPDAFVNAPEDVRQREVDDWLRERLAPVLATFDPNWRIVLGGDVARRGHGTVFWIARIAPGQKREALFVVELRKLPFAQLRQVLYFIFDRLGRRWSAALDASGLGMQMAEEAALKYGSRVAEVTFSQSFYREYGSKVVTSVEDESMTVPADEDIIADICALAYVNGIVKIPDGHSTIGEDGGVRHADAAVSYLLVEHAAGAEPGAIEFQSAGARAPAMDGYVNAMTPTRSAQITSVGFGTVAGGISFEGFGDG